MAAKTPTVDLSTMVVTGGYVTLPASSDEEGCRPGADTPSLDELLKWCSPDDMSLIHEQVSKRPSHGSNYSEQTSLSLSSHDEEVSERDRTPRPDNLGFFETRVDENSRWRDPSSVKARSIHISAAGIDTVDPKEMQKYRHPNSEESKANERLDLWEETEWKQKQMIRLQGSTAVNSSIRVDKRSAELKVKGDLQQKKKHLEEDNYRNRAFREDGSIDMDPYETHKFDWYDLNLEGLGQGDQEWIYPIGWTMEMQFPYYDTEVFDSDTQYEFFLLYRGKRSRIERCPVPEEEHPCANMMCETTQQQKEAALFGRWSRKMNLLEEGQADNMFDLTKATNLGETLMEYWRDSSNSNYTKPHPQPITNIREILAPLERGPSRTL